MTDIIEEHQFLEPTGYPLACKIYDQVIAPIKDTQLKLFVWEDVLQDHTSGIMFSLAKDVDEARKLCRESMIENGYGDDPDNELSQEPKIFDLSVAFTLYGGG